LKSSWQSQDAVKTKPARKRSQKFRILGSSGKKRENGRLYAWQDFPKMPDRKAGRVGEEGLKESTIGHKEEEAILPARAINKPTKKPGWKLLDDFRRDKKKRRGSAIRKLQYGRLQGGKGGNPKRTFVIH